MDPITALKIETAFLTGLGFFGGSFFFLFGIIAIFLMDSWMGIFFIFPGGFSIFLIGISAIQNYPKRKQAIINGMNATIVSLGKEA